MVLKEAGLTIIPVSRIVYRTRLGDVNPAEIFILELIYTFIASITGMISVALIHKLNLFDKVVLADQAGITSAIFVSYLFFT